MTDAGEPLSDELFRGLVEAAPDGIVVTDAEGTIVLVNRQVEVLFGYARDELLGGKVEALVPESLRARHVTQRQGYVEHPRTRPMGAGLMLAARRKDGTEFPVEISLSTMHTTRGPLVSAVVRDVSERRRAQEAASEIKRLKDIAEFRGRFLNIAAHELKTPLTPIRLQLQILKKRLEGGPPETERSLAILSRSVERLQSLMDDVLDAARIQAEKLVLRQQAVSVSDVAAEAVENYRAVARELGVHLTADIQPGVASLGDSGRLLQILTNLLSNALKFTPAGGQVRLTVRAEGPWAAIRCVDSGIGMGADQIAKLFQPFSQVHPDLEATKRGTGLGLYIAHAIIEQHGGTITITSPGPGEGTTATVLLPTTQDRPPERRPDAKSIAMKDRLREMV